MAAIVHFQPASDHPAPLGWPTPTRPARARTSLRVLEGGRSPRAMVRVYRRRRLVALVVALLVVVPAVLGAAWALGAAAQAVTVGPAPVPAVASTAGPVLVVQSGDTLTSIARRLQPTGDIGPLIDRLQALHGPTPLLAGDRLPLGSLEGH